MKKKYSVPQKDKKDWINFTKKMENIFVKEDNSFKENQERNKIRKLDLHGYSLEDANKIVKKFIIEAFDKNYRKLLIVTGKGSRSKSYDNPYISENFTVLKNSIPEYIQNTKNLNSKIIKISEANLKDGGEGAIYIFLKNNNEFIV